MTDQQAKQGRHRKGQLFISNWPYWKNDSDEWMTYDLNGNEIEVADEVAMCAFLDLTTERDKIKKANLNIADRLRIFAKYHDRLKIERDCYADALRKILKIRPLYYRKYLEEAKTIARTALRKEE